MSRWIEFIIDAILLISGGALLIVTPLTFGLGSQAYTNALLLIIWTTLVFYISHTK